MPAEYGLYVCEPCRDDPGEDCGDACATTWTDELPPLWDKSFWPTCRCCGRSGQFVTPLAPIA
jgi:hypothetical protein